MKKFLTPILLILLIYSVYLNYTGRENLQQQSHSSIGTLGINSTKMSPNQLFDKTYQIIYNQYYDPNLNKQNFERWKRYSKEIKTQEDAYIAINSMIASLDDPYSKFLSKEEFLEQSTSVDSKIFGIGVNITSESGKIVVVNVLNGSPALKNDIKPKDIILKVNDKPVQGEIISDVAAKIRGMAGSFVKLEFLRGDKKIVKNIKREEINIETVQSKIIEPNIGYIQVFSFISEQMPKEFMAALEKTKDTKSLIIDLRGNPGGLLPNAIFIANLFIKEGNLLTVVDRKGASSSFSAHKDLYLSKKPVILLIDGASASASEILSGALKDYKRATIVGTNSFGKGLIQQVYPLPNETGLNLTIASYLTPLGKNINKVGVQPDYTVKFTEADFKAGYDRQLNFALKLAKNRFTKVYN